MTASFFRFALCVLSLCAVVAAQTPPAAPPAQPAELTAPAGFTVSVFASDVTSGRLMAVAPDGVLFVARQAKGDVVALPDKDKDGKADKVEVVVANLTRPHSLAFNKGYLYIATKAGTQRGKVAFHSPCTLQHGQKNRRRDRGVADPSGLRVDAGGG